MQNIPMVKVNWLDSKGGDAWSEKSLVEGEVPVEVQTVAYLVKQTKDYVILTMSLEGTEVHCGAWIVIPSRCVVSLQELAVARPPTDY